MLSRLSLRTVLFAAVAALAVLLIGLTIQHSVVAFRQKTTVQAIQEGNATGDLLLVAAGSWAAERGRAAALLNAPSAASASDTALLGQFRQQGDSAFRGALERLRATHSGLPELGRVESAMRQVETIRSQVDSEIAKPGDQRAPQTAARSVAGLTTLVEASQQLRLAAEMRIENAEARIAELQKLKHLAWVTSEFAGRERAAIAAVISAGRAIAPENLEELSRLRGSVELAWGLIDLQMGRDDTSAALKAVAARIKAGYFGDFQAFRERVYRAGTTDAVYPVDANQWFSAATRAIEDILNLNEAIGLATATLTGDTASQATKALAVNVGLLVLGLVVAGFAFWIAAVRVARPLKQLAGTTQRLAEGDTDLTVPEVERNDEVGTLARSIEVFRNNLIDNRRLVAEREAEKLLRQIVDTIPAGISAFDANDRLLIFNEAFKAFYPKAADLIQEGASFRDILKVAAERGQFAELDGRGRDIEAWLARRLREHAKPTQTLVQQLDDGRWVQIVERRTSEGLHVTTSTDITELKLAEQTIRKQAEQDSLTGLANRAAVYNRVERLLADEGPQGLLVVTDLDNFKAINDTLGHDAGDELLVVVGRRLTSAVRRSDIVARLGGDEFAIVMNGISSRQVAERRLARLAHFVQQPVALTGRTVQPRISMGVVLMTTRSKSRRDLFREADLALYQAKAAGRGRYAFFDETMSKAVEQRQSDIEALRTGLQRDELRVAFQPQVNLQTGEPVSLEALARWQRGSEAVSPALFIPLAEESGLIIPLGTRVIEMSLAFQARMRAKGLRSGRVAINVSAAQLKLDDFVEALANQLGRFRLRPADIEIEITETVLLDRSIHQIVRTIEKLDTLGVTIALDDFGTGYASLSHLKQFKVDRLKIDRSFVADIRPEDGRGVIARTIVSLAHSLGMDVVGEGIETPFQAEALRAIGCDIGQGYLLSPPLVPDDTERYLQQRTTVPALPWMRTVA